jgi:hypothetical protein
MAEISTDKILIGQYIKEEVLPHKQKLKKTLRIAAG